LHFIEKMAILQYLRANFLNEKVNYLRAINMNDLTSREKYIIELEEYLYLMWLIGRYNYGNN